MLEPANTVSILQKQAEPKSFSADEVIFKEGDPANYMYGILDGELTLPRLEARGILRSS
ncbi:MAG: cyclic nucleotide-binding domain-containing protein, partial [Coleofasciculus sp. C2-GNP5-27]